MQYILLQAAGGSAPAQGGFGGSSIIFMIAMFAILYFLMIRPQQKKQKEAQQMQESLQVNDKVLTSAGIYGRIVSLKPDKGIVVVEIDDTNKVRVDFQKNSVIAVLNASENPVVK